MVDTADRRCHALLERAEYLVKRRAIGTLRAVPISARQRLVDDVVAEHVAVWRKALRNVCERRDVPVLDADAPWARISQPELIHRGLHRSFASRGRREWPQLFPGHGPVGEALAAEDLVVRVLVEV